MASIPSNKANEQDYQSANLVIEESSIRKRGKKDFTIISNEILKDPSLSKGAKLALIMLLSYCWFGKNLCFPGQERLAQDLSKSVRTVRRYLTELTEKQYLQVTRRGLGKTNHYTLRLSANGTKLTAFEGTKVSSPERTKLTEESNEAKHTQSESDETFSKAQKGMVEDIQTDYHIASSVTTGKRQEHTKENTEGKSNEAAARGAPTYPVNPTPYTDTKRSNPKIPKSGETAQEPKSLKRKDEVIGKGRSTQRTIEPPRLALPPLTQEDMDKRMREKRERAKQQENPLDGIIPISHQETLNRQFGGGTPQTTYRSKRQGVCEKLQSAIERISEELGDFRHVTSNITQAENIRRQAGVDTEQFMVMLYDARAATRYASTMGKIQKEDERGQLVKTPYFYAVLRQKAGLQSAAERIP